MEIFHYENLSRVKFRSKKIREKLARKTQHLFTTRKQNEIVFLFQFFFSFS